MRRFYAPGPGRPGSGRERPPAHAADRAVTIPGADWQSSEGTTAPAHNAVSVYYPFALVDFLEFVESDEYAETGEVLLVFRDNDGCRVTLRVGRSALAALAARLSTAPDHGN